MLLSSDKMYYTLSITDKLLLVIMLTGRLMWVIINKYQTAVDQF